MKSECDGVVFMFILFIYLSIYINLFIYIFLFPKEYEDFKGKKNEKVRKNAKNYLYRAGREITARVNLQT